MTTNMTTRRQWTFYIFNQARVALENHQGSDVQKKYLLLIERISKLNYFYACYGDIDTDNNYTHGHIVFISIMYDMIINLVGRKKFDLLEAAGQLTNLNLDVTNKILFQ